MMMSMCAACIEKEQAKSRAHAAGLATTTITTGMHQSITMVSPLALNEVRDSLASYGREWRESKIPPSVRAAGVHTCRVVVCEGEFTLQFEPQGRGPQLKWVGRLAARSTGTTIQLRSKQTTFSRWSKVALAATFLAFWSFVGAGDFWPVAATVIVMTILLAPWIAWRIAWRSSSQRQMCETVLTQVARAQSIDRSSGDRSSGSNIFWRWG